MTNDVLAQQAGSAIPRVEAKQKIPTSWLQLRPDPVKSKPYISSEPGADTKTRFPFIDFYICEKLKTKLSKQKATEPVVPSEHFYKHVPTFWNFKTFVHENFVIRGRFILLRIHFYYTLSLTA